MNQYVYTRRPSNSIPNVVFALLIANGLVFAAQMLNWDFMMTYFALWPPTDPRSPFMPWQLLTHGFLHGNLTHIAFNMFGLWMFGREIEQVMGSQRFLIYFVTCVIGAGIVQLIVAIAQDGFYPTVGASGGLYGVLLAFAMTFPNRTIMLIFPPIPMKAKYFVLFFGLFSLYLGFSGGMPRVAHFAHLGGMLFGFLLIQYWERGRRRR